MGTEVELKLATSRSELRKALALPWLTKLAAEPAKHQHLTSVYFDTRDFVLRDHGMSLRVRRIGDRRLQTIKASSGALVKRDEWEYEIEGDRPDLKLAGQTALAPLLTGKIKRQLQPVFATDVERVVVPVHIGNSDIELAFDSGRIDTPHDHTDISEIEIELKCGERRDAANLAKRLGRSVSIAYHPVAKAERGYALIEGSMEGPIFANAISIPPSSTVADAFATIAFECLRHLAANEAAVRRGDPAGIHQMRVGARRLRAAFSLFKDLLRDADSQRRKDEIAWLTEQLGPARDYDVFVSKTVDRFRSCRHDVVEFEMLEDDLEHRRKAGFATARAAVESERFRRLVLDTALWIFDGAWRNDVDALEGFIRDRPIAAFAKQELARRTRKITKRSRKLATLDARQRHKLRIAVKKVRYGRQFFNSLNADRSGKKPARRTNGALKDLQNALGSLNDFQVHTRWGHAFARATSATRKAFAIGYLTGHEDASSQRILGQAIEAGKRLRKAQSW
jgi:inorganic triphosphatase YgiF